jgi:acyl-CoA synthetase (AMP-forming)/AMP-acid ligase II
MVVSIYGVLLAGGVVVQVYPPSTSRRIERWKSQAMAIARVVQPAGAIVAPSAQLHMRSILARQGEDLFTTNPQKLIKSVRHADAPVAVQPEDLALVQFTSGTTMHPRGAAITHRSLMANIDGLVAGMSLGADDISVSWLPPFHDMGLIGHIFTPVSGAVYQVLLSPRTFRKNPLRWLQQISELRATQTTAPNAAYEICARRVPAAARRELDLSSLRWALNGAELVHPRTIDRFCRAFEGCGFRREALRPVYGLAETTLAATLGPVDGPRVDRIDRQSFKSDRQARPARSPMSDRISFVSVGRPLPGHELHIIDRTGQTLGPREVGEIRLNGPSVMRGYFNNPEATAKAIDADGWLRTGDLGYVDDDGLLYVTGRRNELIIKNGRNYLPHDIEAAASTVDGVRAGRVVALGVPHEQSGTEELVVYAEVRVSHRWQAVQLRRRIADAIVDATGLRPDRITLLDPGVLPKTTSGKLQRSVVKAACENGQPLVNDRQHRTDVLVPSLRSIAGLLEVRFSRFLGWQ